MAHCSCSTVSKIKAKNYAYLKRGSKVRDNPLTTTFSEGDWAKEMYKCLRCHLPSKSHYLSWERYCCLPLWWAPVCNFKHPEKLTSFKDGFSVQLYRLSFSIEHMQVPSLCSSEHKLWKDKGNRIDNYCCKEKKKSQSFLIKKGRMNSTSEHV